MRLIDADALIDKLKLYVNGSVVGMIEQAPTIDAVPATIDSTLGYLYKVGWIQEHDRIMTEDAAPVRHGCWQITDAYPHNVYCSECHTKCAQTHWAVWEDGSLPRRYCPNCGARMDGEEDEID